MDLESFESDNSRSVVIGSSICSRFKDEKCWLGIDEAGRGPVLGPMVYGICFSPISLKEDITSMGFADSKTLTEENREKIFTEINQQLDKIGWMVHILSPHDISTSMLRRSKYNLNALSHDTAIGLIQRALDRGVNLSQVYVDTVGPPEKYEAKLKEIFPSLEITVAKKADSLYSIVSAASICAKVTRDRVVARWKFPEGIEVPESGYGSGYPGEEKTKQFIQGCIDPVFGFPQFVRFSWSTASKLLEDKAVPVAWEDDDEENSQGMVQISAYFPSQRHVKRHSYFEDRKLKIVSGF